MTEPRILESTIKPEAIEKLGNDTYYYNYNIKEKTVEVEDQETGEKRLETRWDYIQTYIKGTPNYENAITAVIRQYMSAVEETALINKYNSFKLGVCTDCTVCTEYENYCKLVAAIKAQVKKDFSISETTDVPIRMAIPDKAVYSLLQVLIKTVELTDAQALECKELYPAWVDCIGKALSAGDRITYQENLYKVSQDIPVVQATQTPDTTTALYEEISETHTGTAEDPIPYNNNMELTEGLCYTQNGVVYKCTKSTGQTVTAPLKDYIGLYVEIV